MLSRSSTSVIPSAFRRTFRAAGLFSQKQFHTSAFKLSSDDSTPAPSSKSEPTPREVALKWLEKVPGDNKAYNFVVGTSAAALLFGYEIIPYTADLLYAVPFSASIALGYQKLRPVVGNIVTAVIKEEEKIWGDSKAKAEAQLEQDIHAITGSGVTDLVQVTDNLYDYAKELTVLEAEAFEHEQKLIYYTKAKQVLDEWVRYETAVREREQKRIAEQVIARVMEAIQDPKFQDRYLEQCVYSVEEAVASSN